MPEAASEVEKQGEERVRDARVVYLMVTVGFDGDEGPVWFYSAVVVSNHVVAKLSCVR